MDPRSDAITPRDRETLCRVVGVLLVSDGVYNEAERRFLAGLMDRFELDDAQRASVNEALRADIDYARDVESLRRTGQATVLLRELHAAAMADGVFSRPERAMISRVRRIIQYRLGAETYILPLERLNNDPINGTYQRLDRLGEGGFGEVFRAQDVRTGRVCVIKQLKASVDGALTPQDRAGVEDRFWREVALISKLQSPHTVRLLDAGFDVDTPYMVLEYLNGETLSEFLKQGPLSFHQTREILRQVLDAVAEAHDFGIVHRDLKPDNIMLVGRNLATVKVLDFGIAGIVDAFKDESHYTITTPDQILGTPSYTAPEQALQIGIARRESDIYALGLILCECLTGKKVFAGTGYDVLRQQIASAPAPIPPAILEGPFGPTVERATRKLWHQRFGPPVDMIARINAVEASASRDEVRALHRELYRLYSPADELLEAIEQLEFSASPRPREDISAQRQRFFDFLARLFSRGEGSSPRVGLPSPGEEVTRVMKTRQAKKE